MIYFLTTQSHGYTHACLEKEREHVDSRVISYEEAVALKDFPAATYIFTDVDRLSYWQQHKAAMLYRKLKEIGCHVLNDPARVSGRYGLLRRLHRAGINSFNAYRVDELVQPRQWPVFLRMEGDHEEPLSDLIHDREALAGSIGQAVRNGFPLASLLIIEYAAEPVLPGLFRKLSVYRIGDRMLGYTSTHDDKWLVKYGTRGIAPPELYEEEYAFVRDNPFGETVRKAFDLGGLEYGRADFGIVGGRPQIYEINSNPHLHLMPKRSPIERRNESFALFRLNYLDALKAVDTPAG